jgi:hypothetical protein
VPILVVNLITFVTMAFFAGSYEWAYRRLARKAAPQRVSLRDRIRLASICILPFLAWGLYCSFQPWDSYALTFTIGVVTPVTLLYLLMRVFIVRHQLRRLRLAAARAKAPAATEGEV